MAIGPRTTQGFILSVVNNGDGTFTLNTHDLGGGLLVSDQAWEIQGYRIQLHDNGDGTFSPVTTLTTGANDITVEWQGFRLKLHPTGATYTIGSGSNAVTMPLYAIVVVQV